MTTETKIFPILMTVLSLTVILAMAAEWLVSEKSYLLGFLIYSFSVAATGYAYWRLLRLLADKSLLVKKSKELLFERFRQAIEDRTVATLARKLLLRAIDDSGAQYRPYSFSEPTDPHLAITAPESGMVTDVEMEALRELFRKVQVFSLEAPETSAEQPIPSGSPANDSEVKTPQLIFRSLIGDSVTDDDIFLLIEGTEDQDLKYQVMELLRRALIIE